MKIKKLHSHYEEIDITLPAYRRFGDIFYKIISDKEAIQVNLWVMADNGIIKTSYFQSAFDDKSKKITEREFLIAYKWALRMINKITAELDKEVKP